MLVASKGKINVLRMSWPRELDHNTTNVNMIIFEAGD